MFNLEDYETVEERLVKYWKDHPDGQIHTRLLEHTSGRFIVEASIYRTEADARPWTTGLAEERFKVEALMLLLRLRIARLLLSVVHWLTLDMLLKVNEHLEKR